jgi:uncharacterized membrane protein (Fun14 family)
MGMATGVGYRGNVSSFAIATIAATTAIATQTTTSKKTKASCKSSRDEKNNEDEKNEKNEKNENNASFDAFVSRIRSMMTSTSFDDFDIKKSLSNVMDKANDGSISARLSSFPVSNASYGFLAGYVSGFALRKITRISALLVGTSFLAMQGLVYAGYVDVNHDKLRNTVENALDRNGDGVIDVTDLMTCVEYVRKVAGYGIENDVVDTDGGRGDDDGKKGGGDVTKGGNGKDCDGDDDGNTGCLGVMDSLLRLGHDPVVRGHNQDDDIGNFCAARAHRGHGHSGGRAIRPRDGPRGGAQARRARCQAPGGAVFGKGRGMSAIMVRHADPGTVL